MKHLLLAVIVLSLNGCGIWADSINSITAFAPYITKEGKQSFRFVAKTKLPSYYGNADIQEVHEAIISSELGRRQYCLKGYEIISKTNSGPDNVIYEGVCI